jgi:hypothetical protein
MKLRTEEKDRTIPLSVSETLGVVVVLILARRPGRARLAPVPVLAGALPPFGRLAGARLSSALTALTALAALAALVTTRSLA